MDSQFLTSIETRIENRQTFYGRFQLGPFEYGQGLTVANAFRRTLLSECSGLGIIVVQLEGACHEYSTLPGIQESVLEILLNLKQIVLTTCPVCFTTNTWPLSGAKTNLNKNLNLSGKQFKGPSDPGNKFISNLNLGAIPNLDLFSTDLNSLNLKIHKNQKLYNRFNLKTPSTENLDNLIYSKDQFEDVNSHQTEISKQNNFNKKTSLSHKWSLSWSYGMSQRGNWPPTGVKTKTKKKILMVSQMPDRGNNNSCENKKINTTWAKLGYLNIQGPKIVRARDIKLPEPIRCVDPNQYLATLTYGGNLNIKFLICQGKNSIIENLLPINFNQNWFFQYNWFSQQKIVPNPLTYLLLKDLHKNKQIKAKLFVNRQLFLGWQQRKKNSVKKLIKKNFFFNKNNSVNHATQNNLNLKYNSAWSFRPSPIFNMVWSVLKEGPRKTNKNFEKKTNYRKNIISENKKKINKLTISIEPTQLKTISNARPIIVDSIFLPIQKANYSVEIDDTFDIKKERIILEIWTNGSIHPRKAISLAAKRLVRLFYPFINI